MKWNLRERMTAISLVFLMAFGMFGTVNAPAANAQSASGVTIILSYQEDQTGFKIARHDVTIDPDLSENYDYVDGYYGATVTAMDAIVEAHREIFGMDKSDIKSKLTLQNSGFISNFMGDAGGKFTYAVNGRIPSVSAWLYQLTDGDVVELFAIQDKTFYADAYTWFELDGQRVDSITVGTNETFGLTLKGVYAAAMGYWDGYQVGLEGALVCDALVDNNEASVYGDAFYGYTGQDGEVSVSFDTAGFYVLMAVDDEWDGSYGALEYPIVSPWLVVDVTDGGGAASGASGIINSPLTPQTPGEPASDARSALAATLTYMAETVVPSPIYGDEWEIMTLARANYPVPAGYFEGYYDSVVEMLIKRGGAKLATPTDNARLILALTAIGADASNVEGYDLTAPLKDTNWATSQGLNSAIYTLLALDAKPYQLSNDPRAELIRFITGKEISGGGFSFYGTTPIEPDMTGMVLQALTPYKSDSKVASVIARALSKLSLSQRPDGGFESWGAVSPENMAQVVIATATLGIDATKDDRFIKPNPSYDAPTYNPLTSMLRFYMNGGGFQNPYSNGRSDRFSTQQAACALVASDRLDKHKNTLYDMSDGGVTLLPQVSVNKTALINLIASANLKTAADYTAASFSAMWAKLTLAAAVRDDQTAGQATVNAAANALNTAINALVRAESSPAAPQPVKVSFKLIGDTNHGSTGHVRYVAWIETASFEFADGPITVYDLFARALSEARMSTEGAEQGYVRGVQAPASLGGYWLREFDNGALSGWTYTVNGVQMSQGLKNVALSNGDAVVWQYVDNYVESGFVAPSVVPAQVTEEQAAEQVKGGAASESIEYVRSLGLMIGMSGGDFSPEAALTRAMIITILFRHAGEPKSLGAGNLDIKSGAWYGDALAWAVANGVVKGYGGGLFGANDVITREQLSVVLFNYVKLLGKNTDERANMDNFADAKDVSAWAREAVRWAVAEGLIDGATSESFAPKGEMTRGEAAELIMRFVEKYGI